MGDPSSTLHAAFRPGAASGVWCCFLPTLALASALYDCDASAVKPIKIVTLALSGFLAASSVVAAYEILYRDSVKNGVRGVLGHFVSDVFERSSSREARLRLQRCREEEEDDEGPKPPSNPSPPSPGRLAVRAGIALSATLSVSLWLTALSPFASVTALATACLGFYTINLRKVFMTFGGSFTFGEGCLALQSVVLFTFEAVSTLVIDPSSDDVTTVAGSFAHIGKSGLLSCIAFCSLPLIVSWFGNPVYFICSGVVILCGVTLPYLTFTMKREPVSWVLSLIWSSWGRLGFMALASGLVLSSLALVALKPNKKKVSTATRKYFHLATMAVYTCGVAVDPDFLCLSSHVAVCTLILAEAFRFHSVEPFSSVLNSALGSFLDEKDGGALVLTHIYLQVGCSLPLWLSHDLSRTSAVRMLAGVTAIGVGDSAASVVGSRMGRLKLPDSKKTVEGTAASVAAQLLYLWMLEGAGVVVPELRWGAALILPVAACAVVEALTEQVDNVVLPLILYAALIL